ncbi:FAD-dependent oxidoreductase [Pseudenhygromyxa sp. WMMC2535]|uniref:FAD-dependent oxidoreductase n=1 Tax=Pseudenhygromyxa sp. WMMC2535 TaxID=2712867 RepID=UPI0015542836|nr:FAD-dependent oxidoreductase [Pseudenhygromyxa sp. WMMC2535]
MVDSIPEYDAVIIGAGLSGLCAAQRLREAGKRVRVIEARERVGGRTYTTQVDGQPVDLGGQWVGPTQDRVLDLCRHLGVSTFEQFHAGGEGEGRGSERMLEFAGEVRRYKGFLPKLPVFALAELGVAIARLDRLARHVPCDAPWRAPQAKHLDALSVEAWMRENLRTAGARAMISSATEAIFAEHPSKISLLYFLNSLHAGGGLQRLAEVEDGAQCWRIDGGAQQLSTALAERVGAERISLGDPVRAIEQDERGVRVISAKGEVYGRRAILALAPAMARTIEFSPALSPARADLHELMPMGSVIKCVVGYERAFWRERGLSGESVSESLTVRMTFDACGPDWRGTEQRGSGPARLIAFALGDHARGLRGLEAGARRAAVLADLVRLFGPDAGRPVSYVDLDWSAERWSSGCYVGLMRPGHMHVLGAALRAVEGRLHFAGSEAATRWVGYLDGAIESGERAAAELALALT